MGSMAYRKGKLHVLFWVPENPIDSFGVLLVLFGYNTNLKDDWNRPKKFPPEMPPEIHLEHQDLQERLPEKSWKTLQWQWTITLENSQFEPKVMEVESSDDFFPFHF